MTTFARLAAQLAASLTMAKIDWMIKSPWLTTCNCVVGCPCQFNALPSNGHCRAAIACEIEEGHFEIALDWRGSHAHFTQVHFTHQGVVR